MSRLTHVALAVRDPQRSLDVYRDVIGIDGPARSEEYGLVIATSNGEQEWCDEPDYVSIKVLDPDGYAVEVSWDRPASGGAQ